MKIIKCTNQVLGHDNFFEKYLPIKTQMLINDTLHAVLQNKEKRRHEIYEAEKSQMLYQGLLFDDGNGNITDQMRELHKKATVAIEEEEKAKKHKFNVESVNGSSPSLPTNNEMINRPSALD